MTSLGRTMADLFDNKRGADYLYPDGRQVHRTPTKQFSQSGNTKGTALFRADKITADVQTVYVPEGEQDVLAIEAAGGVAVCNAMGAGKAHLFDWTPLAGKTVVIVADNDEPGSQARRRSGRVVGRHRRQRAYRRRAHRQGRRRPHRRRPHPRRVRRRRPLRSVHRQ